MRKPDSKPLKCKSTMEKVKLFKDNFSGSSDWWETISENERKSIERGLSDIEQGKTMSHEDVMIKFGTIRLNK